LPFFVSALHSCLHQSGQLFKLRFHGGTIEATNTLDENGEIKDLLMQILLPLLAIIPSA
jgi:hypothetical protein